MKTILHQVHMETKFCKDCKWYFRKAGLSLCKATGNGIDIISGEVKEVHCVTNRSIGVCKIQAVLFEEKEIVIKDKTLFCKIVNMFKKVK